MQMTSSRINYANSKIEQRITVWGEGLEFDPEDQIVMLCEDKYGPGQINIVDARQKSGFMLLTVEMDAWDDPRELALLESGSLAW